MEESAMEGVRVVCINKVPRDNPHEGITHVGSSNWKWPTQQVIEWIDSFTHAFWVELDDGRLARIAVVSGPNGKYLRTCVDDVWTDDLLALGECP
jgi:hypothetical protein